MSRNPLNDEPSWYVRRPFPVLVWRVTKENIATVAAWCNGVIMGEGDTAFIRVPVENPRNSRQTEAHPGQVVMRSKHRGKFKFKVYTQAWLDHDFTSMSGGEDYDEAEDTQELVVIPTQAPPVAFRQPEERPTPVIFDRVRQNRAEGGESMMFKTIGR